MSDIVANCTYCKNDISDTDSGATWYGNYIYCSNWCAEKDANEKLKSSVHIIRESPSTLLNNDT